MNNTYLYDGGFSSLISLIYYLIKLKKTVSNICSEKEYIKNLFDEPVHININKENYILLKRKIPKNIFSRIYYVYLSNVKNKELIIYDFINNYFKYDNILCRRNITSVNDVLKISQRVSKEVHYMKGFLRFKEMNNFFYAQINPDNNVLGIVTLHFSKRLPNENFIIKDINRNIFSIHDSYNNKILYLSSNEAVKLNLKCSINEKNIEDLWKIFFNPISIKERENKKCQMNFMPKKYWKNIIEMEDNYERSN